MTDHNPQAVPQRPTGHLFWHLLESPVVTRLVGESVFDFYSHQIEHHLFPDVPANRYAGMAVEVKRIAAKHGQHYETGPLLHQFSTVVRRIVRYALPSSPRSPNAGRSTETSSLNAPSTVLAA